MKAAGWYVYSTREDGVHSPPRDQVPRLPKAAIVSADGRWAELHDDQGVERVLVRLGEAARSRNGKRAAA